MLRRCFLVGDDFSAERGEPVLQIRVCAAPDVSADDANAAEFVVLSTRFFGSAAVSNRRTHHKGSTNAPVNTMGEVGRH
jgi:hypothetical protein